MRPMRLGLFAALAIAALAPAVVTSAPKQQPAVSEADRKAGMAAAPGVVQQAGIPCQVADARSIGKSKDKSGVETTYYEVACTGAMGYAIVAPKGGAPTAYTCLETSQPGADGKPSALACLLPGNADPKASLAAYVTKAAVPCTMTNARAIGHSATSTYFEIACQNSPGYILTTSNPMDPAKDAKAESCLLYDEADTNIKCTLTDRATRLQVVDRAAAAANKGCQVKDRRYVGQLKNGDNLFEASCQDGKGYIFEVSQGGDYKRAIDCAQAGTLGGCKLTDTRQAETAQAGVYTGFVKKAGDNCVVDKYALFPSDGSNKETVELVCKDGTGRVGVFNADGSGQVMNCAYAELAGYRCTLTKGGGYAALTADLRKFNQKTCTVSDAKVLGKTKKGTGLIEVACADGFKGYVIEYNLAPTISAAGATGCAFTKCELPQNADKPKA